MSLRILYLTIGRRVIFKSVILFLIVHLGENKHVCNECHYFITTLSVFTYRGWGMDAGGVSGKINNDY